MSPGAGDSDSPHFNIYNKWNHSITKMSSLGLTGLRSRSTFVVSRYSDARSTRTHAVLSRREPHPRMLAIHDKGKPVVRRGRKAMGLVKSVPDFGGLPGYRTDERIPCRVWD